MSRTWRRARGRAQCTELAHRAEAADYLCGSSASSLAPETIAIAVATGAAPVRSRAVVVRVVAAAGGWNLAAVGNAAVVRACSLDPSALAPAAVLTLNRVSIA